MKDFIIKAVLSFGAIFVPIEKTLAVVGGLILLDLVSGVWAAKKRQEPITSAGLRRTIVKLLTYEASLCVGYLAEHYIPGSLPFTNLIGGFISLTEVTSITENLNDISGGSLLKSLIEKLGSPNK